MTAGTFSIQAIRGFQAEQEIPLSPSLTVIYGDNGRGKTSLCEAWHWLFTGSMRQGLEPRSEIGHAATNIHVDLAPRAGLLGADGSVLARRTSDRFDNPADLPESTSPVLLQYRLQQVLYTSQKERREFFEKVLELSVEAEFAKKLRRACQVIDPFEHEAWEVWRRAVEAVPADDWEPPHPKPDDADQQRDNEAALLTKLATFFGCEATIDELEDTIEAGTASVDLPLEQLEPPVAEEVKSRIEAAQEAVEDLQEDAENALARASWRREGLEFAEPPNARSAKKRPSTSPGSPRFVTRSNW